MTKYHFIGIKGTGMSALAQVLHDFGHDVEGSDIDKEVFTEIPLKAKGIKILSFDENNITGDAVYIAGNAFNDEHPEIKKAKDMNFPVVRYHQFLSEFMGEFISIGVTGAHGKTSTTGLLSHVMNGDVKTTYLIGDGTGFGLPGSEYFVFESCEYKRHFLSYYPNYAIITNIDFDHPDYFKDLSDVISAFKEMANQADTVIAYGGDNHVKDMELNKDVWYYGFDKNFDVYASNVQTINIGTTFDVYIKGDYLNTFTIPLFGDHHVLNALSVITVCYLESLNMDNIKSALLDYKGVKRRFTESVIGSTVLVDDYAHHPAEIKATLETARKKYKDKEIISIFQPHTFSRTEMFLNEFAESLQDSDMTYVVDIFGSARENSGTLTSQDLVDLIPGSMLLKEEDLNQLREHKNAVLIFMGAGDIQKYEKRFTELLS